MLRSTRGPTPTETNAEKYRDALARFDLTAERLADEYSVAIEIEPTRFLTY